MEISNFNFEVGQVLLNKFNKRKYKILDKWNNIFGDEMYSLQDLSDSAIVINDFKKYVILDYSIWSENEEERH